MGPSETGSLMSGLKLVGSIICYNKMCAPMIVLTDTVVHSINLGESLDNVVTT